MKNYFTMKQKKTNKYGINKKIKTYENDELVCTLHHYVFYLIILNIGKQFQNFGEQEL